MLLYNIELTRVLKELLKKSNIIFDEQTNNITNNLTEYNEDQGACIKDQYITGEMAAIFFNNISR